MIADTPIAKTSPSPFMASRSGIRQLACRGRGARPRAKVLEIAARMQIFAWGSNALRSRWPPNRAPHPRQEPYGREPAVYTVSHNHLLTSRKHPPRCTGPIRDPHGYVQCFVNTRRRRNFRVVDFAGLDEKMQGPIERTMVP